MLRDVLSFVGLSQLADLVTSSDGRAEDQDTVSVATAERGVSRTEAPRFSALPPHVQSELSSHRGPSIRLVIRGARRAGKTTLLNRLQGMAPPQGYIPSQAIESGVFMWKPIKQKFHEGRVAAAQLADATEATSVPITRVDVWAVVDKGSSAVLGRSTTERNVRTTPVAAGMALPTDATTVDIYRDCQGVIFVMDCTTQHTFDYVVKELPSVPSHLPVAILSNFADVANCDPERREVSQENELSLLRRVLPARTPLVTQLMGALSVENAVPDGCSEFVVKPVVISTSLKEGYGLRPLHAFVGSCVVFDLARQAERVVSSWYHRLCLSQRQLVEINSGQDWQEFLEWKAELLQRRRHQQQPQSSADAANTQRTPSSSSSPPSQSRSKNATASTDAYRTVASKSSTTLNDRMPAVIRHFEPLKPRSIEEEDASFFAHLEEFEEDPVWERRQGGSGPLQHTPSRRGDCPGAPMLSTTGGGSAVPTRSSSAAPRPAIPGHPGDLDGVDVDPKPWRATASAISPEFVAQLANEMERHLRECSVESEGTAGYTGSPSGGASGGATL